VEVLAKSGQNPVLLRQGRILVATFHPELTADTTVHEYFLKLARQNSGKHNGANNEPAKAAASVEVERR
jgi:5'-phosphate synthase pdxT subunit